MSTATALETPYALAPNAGEAMSWFGSTLVKKASSPDLGVLDVVIAPGQEPPMHLHHKEDEWFYMLEGRVTFHVGGQNLHGVAGSFVSFPRQIPHTFTVESDSARFLVIVTPGGFERMFESNPSTPEQAVAALNAFDAEVVGPHPREAKR